MTMTEALPTLDVRKLSGSIGAEIRGVDLHHEIGSETVAEIRAALLAHRVIFFPQQHLGPVEHLAFARNFGEVTPAHPVLPGIDGFPEVFEIDYGAPRALQQTYGEVAKDGETRGRGLDWHTDVTFVKRPPLGSILNAVVIPPAGGDTMFSNQVAAFSGLSETMQRFVETLTAVHDGKTAFGPALKKLGKGTNWEGEEYNTLEPVEHPVVRTHPETGENSLFVNPGFTSHIRSMTRAESAHLLSFLYTHSVRPEYTVRYHWRQGDLGFWDNRATMHSVVGDYGTQERTIQRVTLRGDEPR